MDQLVDLARLNATFLEAVDDALGEFRWRGQALGLHEGLRLVVEPDQVGERSADIDRNENHGNSTLASLVVRLASAGKLRFTLRRRILTAGTISAIERPLNAG